MTTLLNPYFGEFGGMYVPQILMPALRQLEEAFVSAQKDPEFQAQFNDLLKNYAGRPTALTKCQNITAGTNTTLYLKREDLLHGGAHKTNQVLGQALLAKRMGKTEIIAETGAGQHGGRTALERRDLRRDVVAGRILQAGIEIAVRLEVKELAHGLRGLIAECCALDDRDLARFAVARRVAGLNAERFRPEIGSFQNQDTSNREESTKPHSARRS